MGGVGVLFLIIFIVSRYNNSGDSGRVGDKKANEYGTALVILGICLTPIFVLFINDSIFTYFVLIGNIPFIFPSFVSKVLSKYGLVKTSFYLGKISYIYFGRNPFSGGLLRGFQACQSLKNNDAKREALQWLKAKYLARKRKVYSGDMILYVIIDAFLNRPNDEYFLPHQLRLLFGIGQESIPKSVSLLASKFALSPCFANNDWQEIQLVSKQWNTPASNHLVQYVLIVADRALNKETSFFRFHILRLRNRRYENLQLILVKLEQNIINNILLGKESSDISDLWLPNILKPKQILFKKKQLEKQESVWKMRAKELGVWKIDESWDSIIRLVDKAVASKSKINIIINDEQYIQLDREYKNLHYVCHSISNRLDSKSLGTGVENYLDWLRIVNILDNLSLDQQTYQAAFSSVHQVIWNWIAALWNKRKEYCLVHFIAFRCTPIAKESGLKDFHDMLLGLTIGKFK